MLIIFVYKKIKRKQINESIYKVYKNKYIEKSSKENENVV